MYGGSIKIMGLEKYTPKQRKFLIEKIFSNKDISDELKAIIKEFLSLSFNKKIEGKIKKYIKKNGYCFSYIIDTVKSKKINTEVEFTFDYVEGSDSIIPTFIEEFIKDFCKPLGLIVNGKAKIGFDDAGGEGSISTKVTNNRVTTKTIYLNDIIDDM